MEKKYLTEIVLLTKAYNLQDFKDWLVWHLDVIHFDHIVVFDNESEVDIKSECGKDERVEYHFVSGWPDQYGIYNKYINEESKAWWVLPIDDDEFLYVSDKYNNDISDVILNLYDKHRDWCKVSVGWRNMFPERYTEERLDESLILNSTYWSDKASEIFQAGNRPVKTFVKTTKKFEWTDRIGHSTHDPLVNGKYEPSRTIDDKTVSNSWQLTPTSGDADMILYHYQFKCNKEWLFKCKNRKSAATKSSSWKDKPEKYRSLYNFEIFKDDRMINLFKKKK